MSQTFASDRFRDVILVAHGAPSAPVSQELVMQVVADKVERATDGVRVRGTTLAQRGGLAMTGQGLKGPLIVPYFMSDGWFVSTNLPRRIEAAGIKGFTVAPPLGLMSELQDLAVAELKLALQALDLPASSTTLVVAAHGSPKDPRPARATQAFAKSVAATCGFSQLNVGFVDEAPSIEEAASVTGPSILLPFFAARAGHVTGDLPEALNAVRYEGHVLDPIGTWDTIPAFLARSIQRMKADQAA